MTFLLGDRGYDLAPWLITPPTNPQTHQELSFNLQHTHTRSTIEYIIGILKGLSMCLDTVGSRLLYKPEKVCIKRMAYLSQITTTRACASWPTTGTGQQTCCPSLMAINCLFVHKSFNIYLTFTVWFQVTVKLKKKMHHLNKVNQVSVHIFLFLICFNFFQRLGDCGQCCVSVLAFGSFSWLCRTTSGWALIFVCVVVVMLYPLLRLLNMTFARLLFTSCSSTSTSELPKLFLCLSLDFFLGILEFSINFSFFNFCVISVWGHCLMSYVL